MKNETLKSKFEQTVKEYDMLDTPSVLLGLSGGADSSVLFSLLLEFCKKKGIALYAAHINHGIRGDEALRDRDFCIDICRKEGVEIFVLDADVPALSKERGIGLEECARNVRYDFFADIMRSHGIKTLATAHNADDNLETLIFNMLRGAGTKGLSGIIPAREVEGGRLVRPLIRASKNEINEYARSLGIPYVTDSTNADTDYTRNHIRANIVPRLREICFSPEDAATRLCTSLRADDAFIEKCANEFIARENIKNSAPVSLLGSLDDALFFRVISKMCPSGLEYTHIAAIKELVQKNIEHSRLSLPGRTLAVIESSALAFMDESEYNTASSHKDFRYDLSAGKTFIYECALAVNITRTSQSCENIYKNFIHTSIPFDKIEGQLYVRNRLEGDKYTFGGMTRKLKKLLCDAKIPLAQRDSLPIFCDDKGILWVPGFPARERMEKGDNDILNIYIEKNEK